ncbi:MAG TPA: hypothetical protein VFL59_04275, partial [Candidatus Nanopelagicales bacterium]|nr:hypothetical protein [Candidatus Nanopelagicales bacterium]
YRITRVALTALLRQLDAPARITRPTSGAATLRPRIDALVESWDDEVASELFSPNVDGDLPRDRRRSDVAAAVALVGGLAGPAYDVVAHAPSRLVWWRPGATGRLRVEAWLTPELPQRVQLLDVRGVPDPDAALVSAADRIAGSLLAPEPVWPYDIARAPSVALEPLLVEAQRAVAVGAVGSLDQRPTAASSAYDATFEVRGAEARSALSVAIDASSGEVTSCRLVVSGDEWPTSTRTDPVDVVEG